VRYFQKHKEGFILTIVVHLILLFLLFRFGFFTPLPLPEEKGVLIDFGTSSQGMGRVEPAPQRTTPVEQQAVQEQVPAPVAPPVPSQTPASQNKVKEELMTQDFEKTAALDAKKKEEERQKAELEKQQKKQEEEIRQKRIAEERRRRDSLQRIEEARLAEARRLAEIRRQDSLKRAEEQAKVAQIDSRAKNAFGGSGQNTGATSSGQGTTYQPGNQGSPTGTPGTNRYGEGGGEGISFNLTGRSAVSLPKPAYPGENEEGYVVVEVSVDKFGKVTKATPGAKGSTLMNTAFLRAAEQAALRTRFNENPEAPAFQTGTITYRFVLD